MSETNPGFAPEVDREITGQMFEVIEQSLNDLPVGGEGVFYRNNPHEPQVGRKINLTSGGGVVEITKVERDEKRGWKISVKKIK